MYLRSWLPNITHVVNAKATVDIKVIYKACSKKDQTFAIKTLLLFYSN
jgi:hypothetical protein